MKQGCSFLEYPGVSQGLFATPLKDSVWWSLHVLDVVLLHNLEYVDYVACEFTKKKKNGVFNQMIDFNLSHNLLLLTKSPWHVKKAYQLFAKPNIYHYVSMYSSIKVSYKTYELFWNVQICTKYKRKCRNTTNTMFRKIAMETGKRYNQGNGQKTSVVSGMLSFYSGW